MLGVTKAIESLQIITSLLSNTFFVDLQVWREDSFYPSEPIFVPVPGTNEEDGGVILSVVITPNQVNIFLALVRKKSSTEPFESYI